MTRLPAVSRAPARVEGLPSSPPGADDRGPSSPEASPPGAGASQVLTPLPPVLPRGRAETPLPSTPTLIPRPRPISDPADPDLESSLASPPSFAMKPARGSPDPEAAAPSAPAPAASSDKLAALAKISSVTPLSPTAFAALSTTPPATRAPGKIASEFEPIGTITGHAYRDRPPDERAPRRAEPERAEGPRSGQAVPEVFERRDDVLTTRHGAGMRVPTRRAPSEPSAAPEPVDAGRPGSEPIATGGRRPGSEPTATGRAAGARRPGSEPSTASARARRAPSEPSLYAQDAAPRTRADTESRTPGSDFILPANPLSNLTDDQLEGFIDCTLYEETGTFSAIESSIDIRELLQSGLRDRLPTSDPYPSHDERRPFRSSTGQLIPMSPAHLPAISA